MSKIIDGTDYEYSSEMGFRRGVNWDLPNSGYQDESGNNWVYDPGRGMLLNPITGQWIDPALGGMPDVVNPVDVMQEQSNPVAKGSSSGGGGSSYGYGYGSGGSGELNIGPAYAEFEKWFGVGNVPTGIAEQAAGADPPWSALKIRQWSLTNGANSTAAQDALEIIQTAAASALGIEAAANLPEDLIRGLAADDMDYDTAKRYFWDMPDGDILASPDAAAMIQEWMDQTGIPLTYTAQNYLRQVLETYGGPTAEARALWSAWLPTTDSAKNGNYGDQIRGQINQEFNGLLGRDATPEEIESLWGKNVYGWDEYIKSTEDYAEKYKFKPEGMSETKYLELEASWTEAYYQAFGIDIGSLGLEAVENYQPPADITAEVDAPAPEWKPLTTETFQQELGKVGITVSNGEYYNANGNQVAYEDLVNWLPEGEFYYDERGYHYTQLAGAIDPSTGKAVMAGDPGVKSVAVDPTVGGTNVDTTGAQDWAPEVPAAFMDTMLNSGIDPSYWLQSIGWGEDAVVLEAQYSGALGELGREFTPDEWYILASGAIGSGALRAEIIGAQNAVAFREVYRDYNGTDPGPADYDYLMSNFVSPTEYVHRMAAKEYADEKYDDVNELLGRTLGQSVSKSDLENLAMGGKGSGALKAKLNQAARLDAFTWTFKQRTGREPSAAEYQEFLGYTGPEELAWNMDLVEKMAELGPDIQETWNDFYKDSPLSDEQLKIMLGSMEGSGELKYKYKEATEAKTEEERREYYRWQSERARTDVTTAAQGGFKIAMPSIGNI